MFAILLFARIQHQKPSGCFCFWFSLFFFFFSRSPLTRPCLGPDGILSRSLPLNLYATLLLQRGDARVELLPHRPLHDLDDSIQRIKAPIARLVLDVRDQPAHALEPTVLAMGRSDVGVGARTVEDLGPVDSRVHVLAQRSFCRESAVAFGTRPHFGNGVETDR